MKRESSDNSDREEIKQIYKLEDFKDGKYGQAVEIYGKTAIYTGMEEVPACGKSVQYPTIIFPIGNLLIYRQRITAITPKHISGYQKLICRTDRIHSEYEKFLKENGLIKL
ncbi:MAG: hypothetical protein DRP06_01535 [Candidatus Aenigmatarchaeota archaeon]|nr:MAG: hypothetical protein DRP06_01535 [Candidatus Aenigmarchaeota archaeon]